MSDTYRQIDALNYSRLKLLLKSPKHFKANPPYTSASMDLGTAAHAAVLEPERFADEFRVYPGKARQGKAWEKFQEEQEALGRTIIGRNAYTIATAIAESVRSNPDAAALLAGGTSEFSMKWKMFGDDRDDASSSEFRDREPSDLLDCKARVDLKNIDGEGKHFLVDLKTARDVSPRHYAAAVYRMAYDVQAAWYVDGYHILHGVRPDFYHIAVESAAPHDVVVYKLDDEVLARGRERYRELVSLLRQCRRDDYWPGQCVGVQHLELPSWAYLTQEDDGEDEDVEGDDVSDDSDESEGDLPW